MREGALRKAHLASIYTSVQTKSKQSRICKDKKLKVVFCFFVFLYFCARNIRRKAFWNLHNFPLLMGSLFCFEHFCN